MEPLLKSSPLFAKLDKEAILSLRQVLRTRAASTLRRHLPGWRIWVEFTSCEALEPNNPELATLVAFFRGAVGARSLGHGLRFQHEVGGCYPWIRRPAGDAEELCSVGLGASWSRTCSSKGGRAIGKRGTGHHRRREAGGCADTLLLTAFLVKLWSAFASPMPKGSW